MLTRSFSKLCHLLLVILLAHASLFAQKVNNLPTAVNTSDKLTPQPKRTYQLKDSLDFIGIYRVAIPGKNDYAELSVTGEKTVDMSAYELSDELKNYLLQRPVLRYTGIERKKHFAYINYPVIKLSRQGVLTRYEITSAKAENLSKKNSTREFTMRAFAATSVMAPGSGEWYKIGITNTGAYKIDYNFLKSMGINPDTINPGRINIYGNSKGPLPEATGYAITDDLLKNAIYIAGEGDGVFNTNDYIVFYGMAPINWNYSSAFKMYLHTQNNYCDTAYYFINIAPTPSPKRIATVVNSNTPNVTVQGYDYYTVHEVNTKNFIKSGRNWVGEEYDIIESRDFSIGLNGLKTDERVKFYGWFAGYTLGGSGLFSTFHVTIPEGGISKNINIPGIDPSSYPDAAKLVKDTFSFMTTATTLNMNLSFTKYAADSKGWLDYYTINARKYLNLNSGSMPFRDRKTVGAGNIAQFDIASFNSTLKVWNVTSPSDAFDVGATYVPGTWSFVQNTDSLLEFIAFTEAGLPSPVFEKQVPNQDLHALGQVPYLIITHPAFYTQALELSALHAARGIPNHVVTTEQIYNEFSSGMRDAAAIRNFARMFYERAGSDTTLLPKYLLLFGDGSYDNKSILGAGQNFIPTHQSANSTGIIASYTSDDYFGLLDNYELVASSSSLLDLGIGRLVAKTTTEAQDMVNKIKGYVENTPSVESVNCCGNAADGNMGSWRNKLILIADDQDGGAYVTDCEDFSGDIDAAAPELEVQKIYLDATTQTATPGGQRYYEAEALLKSNVQNGALIVNYVGHGGEVGWSHERLLDVSTINGWTNSPKLPVFVTATCEFSRFDDPFRTSAGEYVLLNANGGAVSMLTTTRLVFSGDNFLLNNAFYANVFDLVNQEPKHLGEVIMITKNTVTTPNTRNFCLLGDPAIQLKLPFHKVVLDSINGVSVSSYNDTIKALSVVTMQGHIEDQSGVLLSGFNGVVNPRVYDKIKSLQTLGQDGDSPNINFTEWKNLIFKGRSTVANGRFTTSFIVPKDLNLTVGNGRFVGYANDATQDGHGNYRGFKIGGINTSAPSDNVGPEVTVYLNDDKFVDGGTTNPEPWLVINLKDANGINTVGTGIGHDITCVLDNQTSKTIILNDKYEADKDSYQSGTVKYQLEQLTPGEHTLKIKAFDVYNNSGEREIKFTVAEQTEMALNHVLNYPNPFTTKTEFMFEHNFSCNRVSVQIQIFTVTGKLVKTIEEDVDATGFRVNGLYWDGRDDFGDKLARGTYIYRVKTKANSLTAEKIERLVILY
ncbi:MAG TPA: type IX secretion system sortase PorU [Flavobacteriales bacterium]|nr:type IX secretion system sortase PorU [Flavobacteriales bacterium]